MRVSSGIRQLDAGRTKFSPVQHKVRGCRNGSCAIFAAVAVSTTQPRERKPRGGPLLQREKPIERKLRPTELGRQDGNTLCRLLRSAQRVPRTRVHSKAGKNKKSNGQSFLPLGTFPGKKKKAFLMSEQESSKRALGLKPIIAVNRTGTHTHRPRKQPPPLTPEMLPSSLTLRVFFFRFPPFAGIGPTPNRKDRYAQIQNMAETSGYVRTKRTNETKRTGGG